MRHSIPAILLSLILAIVLQSCREVPEPALPTHEHADRTVVIYMAANNSLGSNGADVDDMDEMSAAMTDGQFPDSTKVVVFHAPYTNGKNHSLLQLERDGSWTTLKTYPQGLSSVSPERMRQALADVITLAPAAHYGLILWSHAMGWTNGPDSKPASVLRSFGLDNRQEMTITDMASALAGFKFEYIYFDCCYMGSVEVIYELRDNAPLIVASPAEVPFDGMPYQTTLPLPPRRRGQSHGRPLRRPHRQLLPKHIRSHTHRRPRRSGRSYSRRLPHSHSGTAARHFHPAALLGQQQQQLLRPRTIRRSHNHRPGAARPVAQGSRRCRDLAVTLPRDVGRAAAAPLRTFHQHTPHPGRLPAPRLQPALMARTRPPRHPQRTITHKL